MAGCTCARAVLWVESRVIPQAPWVESCVIPQTGVTPEVGVTWRVALLVAAQHARRVASGGDLAGCRPWCVQRAEALDVVVDLPARTMHESVRATWSDQVHGEHDASVQECPSRIDSTPHAKPTSRLAGSSSE